MKPEPVTENGIMNAIMIAVSAEGHYIERNQSGVFYTKDGRPVRIGFNGRSDCSGFRRSDARAFFMEVKTKTGRATKEQLSFIAAMQKRGAIAGIVRSVADALLLLKS